MEGTEVLLEMCTHHSLAGSVKKFVYTSSTGVVWKVDDFRGVSEEQVSIPSEGYDSYHHTKAIAEKLVLEANNKSMCTTVIRPCGMVGYVYCYQSECRFL